MSLAVVLPGLAAGAVLAAGRTGVGRSGRRRPPRPGRWAGASVRSDPRTAGRRSRPDRVAVLAGVAGVGLVAALGPGPAGVVAVLVGVGRAASVAVARRRRRRQVDDALPELIDLLVIAAAAGHPVARCIDVVAGRAPPPLRAPLEDVRTRTSLGLPLTESLHRAAPELGPLGPPLTAALADGQATGAPLAATLGQLAATARDRRRRRAEESARRLPVTLLFPLVCCILPAFALLAVVPLLMASLGSLEH